MRRAQLLRYIRGAGGPPVIFPPVVLTPPTFSQNENADLVIDLTANQSGTWTKTGGADQAKFTLSTATLTLPAQDYETPGDANGDNVFLVSGLFTSSLTGLTAPWSISVTIVNVAEIPPTGGSTYQFKPFLRDRQLYRTIMVASGDEFIDLQSEVATPFSPGATSWTIGGADAAKVQQSSPGILVFEPSTRASLAGSTLNVTVQGTNSYGSSDVVNLQIVVPANADCRFASYETGSDANNGTTPALAWKQAPRSLGFTGTQVTLTGGKVLFFRGSDEKHRYMLNKGLSASYVALDHAGTSEAVPFVYAGGGWGGRATFDGSDVVTGWAFCASQADALGNPNWANIEKVDLTTQGGAMDYASHLYCGDAMCWPAQFPTPADPNDFEDALDATEQGGMYQIAYTGVTAGAAPRLYKTASGTQPINVLDTRISSKFGAENPTGWPLELWNSTNNNTRLSIASYTQGTSAVVTNSTSAIPNSSLGKGAYSITHHPKLIDGPGQFALSADRLTLYAWRPNAGTTSVSRRDRCVGMGHRNYVVVEGFRVQRYTSLTGGFAIAHASTATMTGSTVRDIKITQMRADGGEGLVGGAPGVGSGWVDCNIERIHVYGYNPKSSGIRIGAKFWGYVGGTPAQVRAKTSGKIRWCYIEPESIGRTALFGGAFDGCHIVENVISGLSTMHGNGISLNDASIGDGAYCRYVVLEKNLIDAVDRGYTVSISVDSDKTIDRFNYISRNVWLGILSPAMNMYSGEPGSTVIQNLVMRKTGDTFTGAQMSIDIGNRVIIQNNVVAGITYNAPEASAAAYTIQNNLITTTLVLPPHNGTTRVVSGNTTITGAPIYSWNGTFTSEMQATLGAGQIGPFWTI